MYKEEMVFPPEPILTAALHVVFWAGVWTRNWTLREPSPTKQINALWEALHPIPELLHRWRPNAEEELLMYLREYDSKWPDPKLEERYRAMLAHCSPSR